MNATSLDSVKLYLNQVTLSSLPAKVGFYYDYAPKRPLGETEGG